MACEGCIVQRYEGYNVYVYSRYKRGLFRLRDSQVLPCQWKSVAPASGHVLNDDIPNGICIVLRPRTNVDMHEASAPGQILIQDITNGICIALRPRAECRYALYFAIGPDIN